MIIFPNRPFRTRSSGATRRTYHYSKKKTLAAVIILTVLYAAISFYKTLPPINLKSSACWSYFFSVALVFTALSFARLILTGGKEASGGRPFKRFLCGPVLVTVLCFAIPAILTFFSSSRLFHARAYSRILTVKEGSAEDIPPAAGTDSIALMDTESAAKLGNREIGSLSSVVSQYDVSSYTQINYAGTPVKTSPLKYAGFFKWAKNRQNGIPGYVIVDPVSMDADYVALKEGMTYVPSAYFGENLERHIRFRYPTVMFDNLHFEIDEKGNPWYVATVYDHTIGLFGGKQAVGAIVVNPVTGETEKYDAGEIPQWVDCVFDGDLICAQYNDYGKYQDGYWNSIFGQTGCRKVTEYSAEDESTYSDFGYIAKDGDIWIYTGITSLNSDSSNIGFILSNERTEETLFVSCAGADEFSAMASAEGEVQEKGYTASFPTLISMNGKPTYIMVLKDASGLVKMYACVNVEQYNMVATASTQDDCIAKYQALVKGEITQEEATDSGTAGTDAAEKEETAETDTSDYRDKQVTIKRLETIDRNGDTYLYLVDTEDQIYSAKYEDVIDMLLIKEGDTITIRTDGKKFLLPE